MFDKLASSIVSLIIFFAIPDLSAQISDSFARKLLDDPQSEIIRLLKERESPDFKQGSKVALDNALAINLARSDLEKEWVPSAALIQELQQALQLAQTLKNVEAEMNIQSLLLDLSSRSEDSESLAIKHGFDQLLNRSELAAFPYIRALTLQRYALFYDRIQKGDKSLSLRAEALKIVDNSPQISIYVKMKIMEAISSALYDEDKADQAIAIDLRLYQICSNEHWRFFCAINAQNIATTYTSQDLKGRVEQALPYLLEAQKLADSVHDPMLLADIYYSYLKYYNLLGQTSLASEYGNKALQIYQKYQIHEGIRYTLQRLAINAEQQGHNEEALRLALSALETKGPENDNLQESYTSLIRLYKKLGRTSELIQSYEAYSQFLEKQESIRKENDYRRSLVSLGLKSDEEKAKALEYELLLQKQKQRALTLLAVLFGTVLIAIIISFTLSRRMHLQQRKLRAILSKVKMGIVALDHNLELYGEQSFYFKNLVQNEKGYDPKNPLQALSLLAQEKEALELAYKELTKGFGLKNSDWKQKFHNLPHEITLIQSKQKIHLTLDWQPIEDKQLQISHLLLILRDETEQKNLREALELQNEKLINLGVLTASIAHDIASPSQIIALGQSDLERITKDLSSALFQVFSGNEDEETKQFWEFISKKMTQSLEITQQSKTAINRIIAIQSAIRNQSRLEQTPVLFSLRELFDESLTLAHSLVKRLRISIECSPDLKILGMRSQIGQVLTNLLNNASDAVQENPTASEKPCDIRFTVQTDDTFVHILIEDAGVGIKSEIKAKLFQAFFTTKAVGKGTGLGLPICKRIVEEHQGKLTVGDSRDLGGAAFEITLPGFTETFP